MGLSTGLFYFIQYILIGAGYMIGIQCVRGTSICPVSVTGGHYTIGDLHGVFHMVWVSAYFFLQLAGNYDAITDAINSSKSILKFMKETE